MGNGYLSRTGLNNRSFFAALLHRTAWLLIAGLFIATAGTGRAQYPTPFSDDFEAYTLGDPLDTLAPAGQLTMTWSASNVIVTNSPVSG